MKDPEDEAFEELALKQGQWHHISGWRKIVDFNNRTDDAGLYLSQQAGALRQALGRGILTPVLRKNYFYFIGVLLLRPETELPVLNAAIAEATARPASTSASCTRRATTSSPSAARACSSSSCRLPPRSSKRSRGSRADAPHAPGCTSTRPEP